MQSKEMAFYKQDYKLYNHYQDADGLAERATWVDVLGH